MARAAAKQDLIADELDIDPCIGLTPESNVDQQMSEKASEDVEEIAPIKQRIRQYYPVSQLEILRRESENALHSEEEKR